MTVEERDNPENLDAEDNRQEMDSKYRLIIVAAKRSKQLQRGEIPRVDLDLRKTKSTRVAMREFQEKKVNFEILEQK